MAAICFAAGGYEAVLVPSQGANLIRLYHTASGTDILRTPKADEMEIFRERPQIFGLPLLFPPNRIGDGRYTYGGRTYQYPITLPAQNNYHHGIIKTEPFTVALCRDNGSSVEIEAVYVSNAENDAIFRDFPHPFECRMRFVLSADGLEHTVSFHNLGTDEMPLGVGYHTPLNLPFTADSESGNYRLRLSAGKRWELSERLLPTGKLLDLTPEEALLRTEGILPVGYAIEAAYLAEPIEVDGKPYNGAVLTDTKTGRSVYYQADAQMRHWTLWNNGGGVPWVCPEPQTWAINAPNLDMPASVTGFQTVKPGTTWSSTSKLYVK